MTSKRAPKKEETKPEVRKIRDLAAEAMRLHLAPFRGLFVMRSHGDEDKAGGVVVGVRHRDTRVAKVVVKDDQISPEILKAYADEVIKDFFSNA